MSFEFAPIGEFVSRNWLFTVLIAAIGWLWRQVLALQNENASLKAEASSLKERHADFKSRSLQQMESMKKDNTTNHQSTDPPKNPYNRYEPADGLD